MDGSCLPLQLSVLNTDSFCPVCAHWSSTWAGFCPYITWAWLPRAFPGSFLGRPEILFLLGHLVSPCPYMQNFVFGCIIKCHFFDGFSFPSDPPWCNTSMPQDLWEICRRLCVMVLWAIYIWHPFFEEHTKWSFATDGIPLRKAHCIGQQSQVSEGPAISCGHDKQASKLHWDLGSQNHMDAKQEFVTVKISHYPSVTLLWFLATY